MKRVLMLFLIIAPISACSQWSYKINAEKIAGWSGLFIAGAADGAKEGFTFDNRKSFERKYGVNPYGYFGSESWRMVYRNGDPVNGFKSPAHSWAGAQDFYHHADDLKKYGYIAGGFTVAIGGSRVNTKWWHYALDFGISFGVSAFSKAAAMHWIRQ